jgi:hypothetical protein
MAAFAGKCSEAPHALWTPGVRWGYGDVSSGQQDLQGGQYVRPYCHPLLMQGKCRQGGGVNG